MIFYLAIFVNGPGFLAYENRIKLKKKDIQNKLSINYSEFSDFYSKLVEEDIIRPEGIEFKRNNEFNFHGTTSGKAKHQLLVRT